MSDLREKTVELIMKEGQFDMEMFSPDVRSGPCFDESKRNACGTACCIAGNICVASGLDIFRLRWNAIPEIARQLWANEYDWDEAERLQFTEDGWGERLDLVTPEEAVAHLRGSPPVVHNEPYEDDENDQ